MYFAEPASQLAKRLLLKSQPQLLFLEGPLGSGKTTFAQALLASLGWVGEPVQSPTFLKLLEYDVPGFGLVVHIDTYRMEDEMDVQNLGLENYQHARLWIVEWPELFVDYLKSNPQIQKYLGFKLDAAIWGQLKDYAFLEGIKR